jgi:DnaK suppressor protein
MFRRLSSSSFPASLTDVYRSGKGWNMGTITATQMEKLGTQLRERRSALLADIRRELQQADGATYADLAGRVHDSAEEAVADHLVDLGLAIIDRQITELREVEAALARTKDGSYGLCETCGEAIALARLSSQPSAARCLPCQERFERASAHGEVPRL